MILNKKAGRDLRRNWVKHTAFILLIMLSVMVLVGFNRSMDGYAETAKQLKKTRNVEDGSFETFGRLSREEMKSLKETGTHIQENFLIDVEEQGYKLRLMSGENSINRLEVTEGEGLTEREQIVLDKKFADEQGYAIGDELNINGENLKIVGYGISPDYIMTIENKSDFINDPKKFGVGYLTEDFIESKDWPENRFTSYSFDLKQTKYSAFKKELKDIDKVKTITLKADNPRIQAVFDDVAGPKKIAMIAGVLLMLTVIFIITISVINSIKEERIVIGILYSQGMRKKQMLCHYMMLPLFITMAGSVIGYFLGIVISPPLTLIQTEYNMPEIQFENSFYLIFFGIILPVILAIIIPVISISGELSKAPLELLKGSQYGSVDLKVPEEKQQKEKKGTIGSFTLRFRLKGMRREKGSYVVLFIGVLLANTVLNMGFYVMDSSTGYMDSLGEKIPFERMYTVYEPMDGADLGDSGEEIVNKSMKLKVKSGEKTVMLQGTKNDSAYFDMKGLEENEVKISSGLSEKFRIEKGDSIELIDPVSDEKYVFKVKDVIRYDISQNVFIPGEKHNELFEKEPDYYNGIISMEKLDIPSENIVSVTTAKEIKESAKQLLDMIRTLSKIMIGAAIVIVIAVVYILMLQIVGNAQTNISMMRIFGYRESEVQRLYTRGNIIFVLAGWTISLFTAKVIARGFYDSVFENMQQYFITVIKGESLIISMLILLLAYGISVMMTKYSASKIKFSEAIKNRE